MIRTVKQCFEINQLQVFVAIQVIVIRNLFLTLLAKRILVVEKYNLSVEYMIVEMHREVGEPYFRNETSG